MKFAKFVIIISSSFLLSGCYYSEKEIITNGDYIMDVGVYECLDSDNKKETKSLNVETTGFIFKDYKYVLDANFIKFRDTGIKIDGGRQLAIMQQYNSKSGYFDFSALEYSKTTFIISSFFLPGLVFDDQATRQFSELAGKHSVGFKVRNEPNIGPVGYIISGNEKDIVSFLIDHPPAQYKKFLSCQKIPQ